MIASDFKKWAREALRGRWGTAILVCLTAMLLTGGVNLVSNIFAEETPVGMVEAGATMITITIVSLIVALVIGGAVTLGQTHYFINLVAHRPSGYKDVFSRFGIWHKGIWMSIVIGVRVALWALLGVLPATLLCGAWLMGHTPEYQGMMIMAGFIGLSSIPGVIASYRYAMTCYVLAEFPELSVKDAIKESKRLMDGNKWRMYSMHWSFLGWYILSAVTMGIANLWLLPYRCAADAAFYMDVTGRSNLRYTQPTE